MSFVDAAGIFKSAKTAEAIANQGAGFDAPDLQLQIEEIAKRENNKKAGALKLNDSQRLAGIKSNRVAEREIERECSAVNLKPDATTSSADVIDIKTGNNSETIEYPSLDDFLGDDDD